MNFLIPASCSSDGASTYVRTAELSFCSGVFSSSVKALYTSSNKLTSLLSHKSCKKFDEAAAKQSEAEELKTKYEAVLSDAENEKKKVVAEARKTADEEYQRIVTDAHKTASQIKDDAEAEAISQKEQILKKAEKEIADMVVDAAAKVVGSNSADTNAALYDTFLNKAGDK